MSKKLSEMTVQKRIEHWVHQHTVFVVGDPGPKRAAASALRLICKLTAEMDRQADFRSVAYSRVME